MYGSKIVLDPSSGVVDGMIKFGESSDLICFEDVLIAQGVNSTVRIRNPNFLLIVRRDSSAASYRDYLRNLLTYDGDLAIVRTVPAGAAEATVVAGQFANLYLTRGLHETTIGAFVEDHREIILSALGGQDLISEPYLPWQEGGDPDEKAINPDLLVKRIDGYWDVYDLKLPLLENRSITRGLRRRRRFVGSVYEGISQLAHYREYFGYPENRDLARQKYGVEVQDLNCGLIVGNKENVNSREVSEALRAMAPISVVDYDSLLQMYLLAKKLEGESNSR